MGGSGGRRIGRDLGIASAATAVLPPLTAALAIELAPVRVNLIAAGFVDTPLSASLLGDALEARREQLGYRRGRRSGGAPLMNSTYSTLHHKTRHDG